MNGRWLGLLGLASCIGLAGCGTVDAGSTRPGAEARQIYPAPPAVSVSRADPRQKPGAQVSGGPGAAAPALQSVPAAPVNLRVALSHASYTQSNPQNLLLKLDYAGIAAAPINRPLLNIALVLDRSNSMAEDRKLPYTLEAARWVLDNLTARDVVSLIAFNEQVVVLSAAGRVVNKEFLFHRLEEVYPAGFTDLSGGLLEGIAQVSSQSAEGQVKQVFLLTDGLANRGVTDSPGLQNIVQKAQQKGINVSTFGCGTEFNERLLTDMAGAGGGRYTYIKSPDRIPVAFMDELRGLLQAVAQNATLEFRVNGGQISKIYGQALERPTAAYKLPIGVLRAGERGLAMMEIKPDVFVPGAKVNVEMRLTYDDPQTSERTQKIAHVESAFMSVGGAGLQGDPDVLIYGSILGALDQAEEAVEGLDTERFGQLKDSYGPLYERARQHALQNNDQELLNQAYILKHFMEEAAAAETQGLLHGHNEARDKFQKASQYRRYLLSHHRPQP